MNNLDIARNHLKKYKIVLCDCQRSMCDAWAKYFSNYSNIFIYNDYFENVIKKLETGANDYKIAIASPANSYGLMDGGYDKAITDYFGKLLQLEVQNKIMEDYCGEQPVGSSFAIDIPSNNSCVLIHTPTMRRPSPILDSSIIYHCTRSSIICAISLKTCDTIVLPAFGALTGQVQPDIVAYNMERAIAQLFNPPTSIPTWKYVREYHPLTKLL